MRSEIWDIGEGRKNLWENNPGRAARLAYLQVLAVWDRQVWEESVRCVSSTDCTSGRQVQPDPSAGMYVVPGKVKRAYPG